MPAKAPLTLAEKDQAFKQASTGQGRGRKRHALRSRRRPTQKAKYCEATGRGKMRTLQSGLKHQPAWTRVRRSRRAMEVRRARASKSSRPTGTRNRRSSAVDIAQFDAAVLLSDGRIERGRSPRMVAVVGSAADGLGPASRGPPARPVTSRRIGPQQFQPFSSAAERLPGIHGCDHGWPASVRRCASC